jgi:hypothetical protein
MTKNKKKTEPSAAEQRDRAIAEMMAEAKEQREENAHLIRAVKEDPALAKEVRELLCADLRRVAKIPRHILGKSSSRDRYRQHGHYSEQLVRYTVGTWAEFQRQAGIKESLATGRIDRNISKTLRAQQQMQYAQEHIKPWDGAYDRLDMDAEQVVLMIGSDWHSRYTRPFALRVWREVRDMVAPDGIRYNGDIVDFPKLSRHRDLPGAFPLTVGDEVAIAKDIMGDDREALPDADIRLVMGNHDIRFAYGLADAPGVYRELMSQSYAELFGLDELEVGLVARPTFLNPSERMRKNDISQNWETLYDAEGRPFWTTVHGFLHGKNAARDHMVKFGTWGTNGHLHAPVAAAGGSLATGPLRWFQTGAMASPRGVGAGYVQGPIEALGWASTFLVVRLFPRHRHIAVEEIQVGDSLAYYGDHVWTPTVDEIDAEQAMLEV